MSVKSSRIGSTNPTTTTTRFTTTSTFDDESLAIQKRENLFFPLYAEISKRVHIPSIVYLIVRAVSIAQLLAAATWTVSNHVWKTPSKFHVILDCNINHQEWKDSIYSYIVLICILILMIGFKILVFLTYKLKKQTPLYQMYLTQIFDNILLPMTIPLYVTHLSRAFIELSNMALHSESIVALPIIYFGLMLLGSVFTIFIVFIDLIFTLSSPILHNAFDATWDPQFYLMLFSILAAESFFAGALNIFSNWLTIVFIIIAAVFQVFLIYKLFFFPFFKFETNFMMMSVMCTCFCGRICVIPRVFGVDVPVVAFIGVMVAAFIISLIAGFVLLTKKKNKIVNQLSYSIFGGVSISDHLKREHFDEIGFKSNDQLAAYLRIGISEYCDMFIDFSFAHFVVDNYSSRDILMLTVQMISLFPSELQFFGYILGIIEKLGKLSISEHFLYFQLRKVHVMRQSALSAEASSQIRKLNNQSMSAISSIRSFWKEVGQMKNKFDLGMLLATRDYALKVNGIFQDVANKFSNNQQMCEEYARYLFEGMGNYIEGIKWYNKSRLLELGKRMDRDHAFKSLVNIYPNYLINHIVDTRGNFIEKQSIAQVGSSKSFDSTSSDTAIIDQKLEEMSNGVISQAKLRVNFQHVVDKMKFGGVKYVQITSVMILVFALIIYIILLSIGPSTTRRLMRIVDDCDHATDYYLYMEYSSLITAISLAQLNGIIGDLNHISMLVRIPISDYTDQPGILHQPYEAIYTYTRLSRDLLRDFSLSIVSNIDNRVRTHAELFYNEFQFAYFMTDLITGEVRIDTGLYVNKSVYEGAVDITKHSARSSIIYVKDPMSLANPSVALGFTHDMINSIYNAIPVLNAFNNILQSLTQDSLEEIDSISLTFYLCMFIIPILFLLIFSLLQIHSVIILYSSMKKVWAILVKVNKEIVEESFKPIMITTKENTVIKGSSQVKSKKSMTYYAFPVVYFATTLVNAILLFLPFYIGYKDITQVHSVFNWYNLGSARVGNLLQVFVYMSISMVTGYHSMDPTDYPFSVILDSTLMLVIEAHKQLLIGSNEVGGVIGFNYDLDNHHFIDVCDDHPDKLYKYFTCLSVDRAIDYAISYSKRIIKDIHTYKDTYRPLFKDDVFFANLLVMTDLNLIPGLQVFQQNLLTYSRDRFNQITKDTMIFSLIGIVVTIILITLLFVFMHTFDIAFEAVKQLIRLLPPSYVLKNHSLLNFIFAEIKNDDLILSPSEALIEVSPNAIISVSKDFMIESVNNSFRKVTGFMPDEVLGQKLDFLFHDAENSSQDNSSSISTINSILSKMEEMKSSNQEQVIEQMMQIEQQGDGKLIVKTTVISIFNDEIFSNFVILLRDMAEDIKREQQARRTKHRSEKILQKIVPPQVYESLKKKEAPLFNSHAATIISIEIVGLMDTVNTLSPNNVLNVLGQVIEMIDLATNKYPAVHSIKMHDDQILLCCGLFDFLEQPELQVEQALMFCIEINRSIEELNIQLAVDLSFRIGINFGGPLVGNVLDVTTPTFDILGSIIGLTIKMASDGIVGKIQVSESVKKLVDTQKFVIVDGGVLEGASKKPDQIYYIEAA